MHKLYTKKRACTVFANNNGLVFECTCILQKVYIAVAQHRWIIVYYIYLWWIYAWNTKCITVCYLSFVEMFNLAAGAT